MDTIRKEKVFDFSERRINRPPLCGYEQQTQYKPEIMMNNDDSGGDDTDNDSSYDSPGASTCDDNSRNQDRPQIKIS